MAEHFKLEITNRSTKITTWTGVSDDFANEYKERLGVDDSLPDDYIPAPMSDALKTVLNPPPPENADKDKPNENQIVSKSSAKKNDGKYAKYNYAKRVKKRRSTFRTLAYLIMQMTYKLVIKHFKNLLNVFDTNMMIFGISLCSADKPIRTGIII